MAARRGWKGQRGLPSWLAADSGLELPPNSWQDFFLAVQGPGIIHSTILAICGSQVGLCPSHQDLGQGVQTGAELEGLALAEVWAVLPTVPAL